LTYISAERDVSRQPSSILVATASIGNALEWFDILVYGYLAVTLSKLFFPASNETVSLLLTFGTFAASYAARPLGALILGGYGDRAGRKSALSLSILLMTLGTLIMAVTPTYQSIGIYAPLAVLCARLIQGFAIGGEFGGVTSFLVEHGASRRGFFASFQWSGQGLATVLASLSGIGLATLLTPDEVAAWGWRLPYLFGLLVGPVGLYLRRKGKETPEFSEAGPSRAPVREVFKRQWQRLLLAAGACVASTSSNYLIVYMPTYAIKQLNVPSSGAFTATLLGGLLLTFGSPLFGHLSDRVGRTRIMLAAAALMAISAYPAFVLLTAFPSLTVTILMVCWLSLLKTAYSGVLPALLADIFPTKTRSTGMSLAYNISVPLFGGTAPLISASLIEITGSNLAPGFYLVATALLSVAVLVVIRRSLGLK